MALISCPECGHIVSDSALACPNCGYNVSQQIQTEKDHQQLKLSMHERKYKATITVLNKYVDYGIFSEFIVFASRAEMDRYILRWTAYHARGGETICTEVAPTGKYYDDKGNLMSYSEC